jgi:hypothetical protein
VDDTPVTVAVNCCVAPGWRETEDGLIAIGPEFVPLLLLAADAAVTPPQPLLTIVNEMIRNTKKRLMIEGDRITTPLDVCSCKIRRWHAFQKMSEVVFK